MTKNPKHDPLLRGPFPSALVAAVADVPPSTVRSWDARGFVNACEMWPKIYLDERERQRKAARKVRAKLAAAGEDVAWIDETLERMEQRTGPRVFADVELLQVCALAELGRNGISPSRARAGGEDDTYLLDNLTRELAVRAFLVPAVGDREPLGPHTRADEGGAAERYLVAELMDGNASLSLQVLTPRELHAYFDDPYRKASTMWTVIDCDALLARILDKLNAVKPAQRAGAEP